MKMATVTDKLELHDVLMTCFLALVASNISMKGNDSNKCPDLY